jgi:hypothetical protein
MIYEAPAAQSRTAVCEGGRDMSSSPLEIQTSMGAPVCRCEPGDLSSVVRALRLTANPKLISVILLLPQAAIVILILLALRNRPEPVSASH